MYMEISNSNQKQFEEIVCLIKAKQNRAVMSVNSEYLTSETYFVVIQ